MRRANIHDLHRRIKGAIRRCSVTRAIAIGSTDPEKSLDRLGEGERIQFELSSTQLGITLDTADRELGGRVAVVPLFVADALEPTVWIGWYDGWEKIASDSHRLVGVSLSFFWGVQARHKKQLMRAEWDAPDRGATMAGQPHWHIDAQAWSGSHPESPGLTALSDVPAGELVVIGEVPEQPRVMGFSKMHLAMGGWLYADRHPAWWRRDMPADWAGLTQELPRWVERTLLLTRDQFASMI